MTTYFVASGGSNTAPYENWTKAATSLATALAAASTAGDVVVIQYDAVPSGDAALSVDTTYTFAANISLVSATNGGGTTYTLQAMDGVNQFIGSSSTSVTIAFAGADRACKLYGIALRNGSTSSKEFRLATGGGQSMEFDTCFFYVGTNNGAASVRLTYAAETFSIFKNCTFRFSATGQYLACASRAVLIKCSLDSNGTAPTTSLFSAQGALFGEVSCIGCDWSFVTNGSVVPNIGQVSRFYFDRCKFGTGVTLFATQTSNPTYGSAEAWFNDCIQNTTRLWQHSNALGTTSREATIYYTGSPAGSESWKIVGTANATYRMPYCSPWVEWYNTGTSAVTPRFEILRDGSATAYKDTEVWAEFSWKNTSSSPLASGYQGDSDALADFLAVTAGSDQATGAGTGSWTGENATAWSGKVDSGSAITPTEAGILRGRVCVTGANTVYVDPVIRTA